LLKHGPRFAADSAWLDLFDVNPQVVIKRSMIPEEVEQVVRHGIGDNRFDAAVAPPLTWSTPLPME